MMTMVTMMMTKIIAASDTYRLIQRHSAHLSTWAQERKPATFTESFE